MKQLLWLLIPFILWGEVTRDELHWLERDAIVIGYGLTPVYVFVDPMCSNSQNYISLISGSETLQKQHTYYIFLHRLEKFDSDAIIDTIYRSKTPINVLMQYIASPDTFVTIPPTKKSKVKRQRITKIAQKTGMKRRPYIIIYPLDGLVCKISEGSAPCTIK